MLPAVYNEFSRNVLRLKQEGEEMNIKECSAVIGKRDRGRKGCGPC